MTIHVQCQCGARLGVADEFAGKRGKCPKCGAAVAIPSASAPAGQQAPTSPAAGSANQPMAGGGPPAGSSVQPQFHNPLHGGGPPTGQPQAPYNPADAAWGGAAWGGAGAWQGAPPAGGMPPGGGFAPNSGFAPNPGFGAPAGSMPAWNAFPQGQFAAPAANAYPQQQAAPRTKRKKGSGAAKPVKWGIGGIVGVATAVVVSMLVRNALQADLGNLSWRPHQSAQGRFRVELPGVPKLQSKPIATNMGMITLQMEGVELDRNTGFMVMYNDYPAHMPFDAEGSLQGAVMGLQSQGVSSSGSTPVECDGHPGREVYFTAQHAGKSVHGRARLFVVGRRLYQLHYLGNSGTEQHPNVERFFNSFHPQ